jgi:hypothetical protein
VDRLGVWMRMEKILCTVPHEAHKPQVQETIDALFDEPEGVYG